MMLQRIFSFVVLGLTGIACGCGATASHDTPNAPQGAATSISSPQSNSGTNARQAGLDAPADALRVENAAMTSIQPKRLPADQDDGVSALAIANPQTVQVLVPKKTFAVDQETGALKLTFADLNLLTVLNMDPVTEDAVSWMPEWMTSLEGKRVRIRGFMWPTFEEKGVEAFHLVWSAQETNFGAPIQVYNILQVTMKTGTTTDWVPLSRSFDVVGRFKIDLQSENGQIYQLFAIEDASVITR